MIYDDSNIYRKFVNVNKLKSRRDKFYNSMRSLFERMNHKLYQIFATIESMKVFSLGDTFRS